MTGCWEWVKGGEEAVLSWVGAEQAPSSFWHSSGCQSHQDTRHTIPEELQFLSTAPLSLGSRCPLNLRVIPNRENIFPCLSREGAGWWRVLNYSCLRAEEASRCGIWNLLCLERWGGSEFGLYLVTGFYIKVFSLILRLLIPVIL